MVWVCELVLVCWDGCWPNSRRSFGGKWALGELESRFEIQGCRTDCLIEMDIQAWCTSLRFNGSTSSMVLQIPDQEEGWLDTGGTLKI